MKHKFGQALGSRIGINRENMKSHKVALAPGSVESPMLLKVGEETSHIYVYWYLTLYRDHLESKLFLS